MTAPQRKAATRLSLVTAGRVELGRHVDAVTADQVRVWAAAWQSTYDDLVRAVAAQARASSGSLGAAHKAARLDTSLQALTAQLRQLGKREGVRVAGLTGPAVSIPVEVQRQLAGASGLVWNLPPERELQAIVQRTSEQVASRYLVLTATAEEELRRAMVRGIAAGVGPREAARQLVGATQSATALQLGTSLEDIRAGKATELVVGQVQGAFAGGLARANNLLRTELLDASRLATRASYAANPGLVGGWRWLATLDRRTCPACWGMHNTVHPATDVLEGHQSCRCAPVPILAGDDELDPKTGRTLDDLGHPDDAFRKLGRDEQLAILGPKRLEAFEAGTPLRQFAAKQSNVGWRDSYHVAPLRDLPPPGSARPAPPRAPAPPRPAPAPDVSKPAPHALEGISLGSLHEDDLLAYMGDPRVVADERALAHVLAELDRRDAAETAAQAVANERNLAATRVHVNPTEADVAAWGDAWGAGDANVLRHGGELPPKLTKASRDQQTRAEFEVMLEANIMAAYEATNGYLLSAAGKRAGITERTLFEGSADASVRYASEELRRFWSAHPGNRMTFTEYRAPTSARGRKSRATFLDVLRQTDVQTGRRQR